MSEPIKTAPTLEDLRARRAEILAIAEKYGAYNLRVFGSVARGDATPNSDVDILVSFRAGTTLMDLSGLWQDLEDMIGGTVDVVEDYDGLRENFRQHILKDAVAL